MDEQLREEERRFERGEIDAIQWMKVLQRAGLSYNNILIGAWEKLLAGGELDEVDRLSSDISYSYLTAAIELLKVFPIRCNDCKYCPSVRINGFCICCLTGVCDREIIPPETWEASHRAARIAAGHMSTIGCKKCIEEGCKTIFPDQFWQYPGILALTIEWSEDRGLGHHPYPVCLAHHYRRSAHDDNYYGPTEGPEVCSTGFLREQLRFIMRHASCRIEDPSRIEERDANLEEWRNIISDLGPGELPPY